LKDFTKDGYRRLVCDIKDGGYRWAFFTNDAEALDDRPVVRMRHDVDFDVAYAVEMAEIEAELGVCSTYFFHLRGVAYNLLSAASMSDVQAILSLGHRVSLHIGMYPEELATFVQKELEIFARALELAGCVPGIEQHGSLAIVSFHRPDAERVIRRETAVPWGVTHTYAEYYMEYKDHRGVYFSDSRCMWGPSGRPLDSAAFAQRYHIQILTHPIWWMEEGESAREKLDRLLGKRNKLVLQMIQEWRLADTLELAGLSEDGSEIELNKASDALDRLKG
jgi:hypothetical protein